MTEYDASNVNTHDEELSAFMWWGKKRLKYNVALVLAGFFAFICYATVCGILSESSSDPEEYEITLFTTVFQGIMYLIMMGIANICYYVGPISEKLIRPKNVPRYRNITYNFGLWFSVSLPFSIPVLLLVGAGSLEKTYSNASIVNRDGNAERIIMTKPQIEILGVFRLPVTEELFREQFEILYGYEMSAAQRLEAERACREQLSSTVLIEALVKNRDRHFDVGRFTQPADNQPEDSWQVAWAEAFLTLDGSALLVERWGTPPEEGDLRIAFFMHCWEPAQPLRTSYGEIMCPEVQEMPERLQRLVPYEPVD